MSINESDKLGHQELSGGVAQRTEPDVRELVEALRKTQRFFKFRNFEAEIVDTVNAALTAFDSTASLIQGESHE